MKRYYVLVLVYITFQLLLLKTISIHSPLANVIDHRNHYMTRIRKCSHHLNFFHMKKLNIDSAKFSDIRGGNTEEAEEENNILDDDTFEDEEDDDSDVDTSYSENSQKNAMLSSILDSWIKTPPITQIYIGSSILLTLLAFVANKNIWPEFLNLDWTKVFTKLQIWRPLSAFLFFGPFGLNFILTIQFVWMYMAQLEKLNYNKPEEFLIMLLFGGVTLIGSYSMLGLSSKFLGHNLSTYLVYIWARLFEGTEVNVMDLFFLKAEILPWFFCVQTLILEGEIPFADLLGIVVGHLYHYLTKQNILKSPAFLRELFSKPSIKQKYLKFKEDFE